MIFSTGNVRGSLSAALPLLILAATSGHSAPVVTPNGFLVKFEVNINAPPARVYDALVSQVGSWWDSEHTYSGDARNLSIEARPGGCFCEKLSNGGAIEHLRVIYVAPGKVVRFSGALGPLQASGVAGTMTCKLDGAAENTRLQLTYSVGGFMESGFEKVAPTVESVLRQQFDRLKLFVETGKPTGGQ